MKKAIAIVLSLILMFAFTAVTFAAEKAKAKSAQVTGEVTAVDAKANTITVKGKKGEVTISVDEKTKMMPKGKTLADVKAGDKVTVKYSEAEGKNTAKSVEMKAAPMKKEEAPMKKEAAPAPAPAPAKKAPGY
jgi:ribosomal protein S1